MEGASCVGLDGGCCRGIPCGVDHVATGTPLAPIIAIGEGEAGCPGCARFWRRPVGPWDVVGALRGLVEAAGDGWRCTGIAWGPEGARLGWCRAGAGAGSRDVERASVPAPGRPLAFAVEGGRVCTGVSRGGRRTVCPVGAAVPARSTSGQCAECARLDRSRSVAADTRADDPQPYCVYLAYFGPGLLKVGITAAGRGATRLLEQGAVAYSLLGRGPLMAARRAEELLGAALGVKDRVPYGVKRAVRAVLPPVGERFAELAALHARVAALPGWPESLEREPCEPVDHTAAFDLDLLAARVSGGRQGEVTELGDGVVVAGELLGVAGPDLHLGTEDGVLVLDGRLMAGWRLRAADPGQRTTAALRDLAVRRTADGEGQGVQDGLF
ncbi:DUF2797 domain-containing protein [Streptomyces sp. 8N616]|uniref:DUF2797 domain-containing protein n=1 Tax=Streptomyces sp. 8N616 TaxID=3457414 RepID=UPI003FD20533